MTKLTDQQKLDLFDTAIQQRNTAWDEFEAFKSRIVALEGHLAKYRQATETVLDRYDIGTSECIRGNYFTESTDVETVLDEIDQELSK